MTSNFRDFFYSLKRDAENLHLVFLSFSLFGKGDLAGFGVHVLDDGQGFQAVA